MNNTFKKLAVMLSIFVFLCGCTEVNFDVQEETVTPQPTPEVTVTAPPALEVTITPQPEKTDEFFSDDWETSDFPLYSMLKRDDIYLYGTKPYGMVLYQNGYSTYFDWSGLTPHSALPHMLHSDLDDCGEKELAVILCGGSDAGMPIMELHILKIADDGNGKPKYTDYALLSENAGDWIKDKVSATLLDDKNTFAFEFGEDSYKLSIFNNSRLGAFSGNYYGNIVGVTFEGSRIKTVISFGAYYENNKVPILFSEIEAYAVFDGEKIVLEDIHSYWIS